MRWSLVPLVVLVLAAPLAAEPSPPQRDLPGEILGDTVSRWIAPYVLLTRAGVGGRGHTRVRWFDEVGKVTRDLSGPGYYSSGPFVSGFSTLDDFRLLAPQGTFEAAYTSDGTTAAFLQSAGGGEVVVQVYERGRYARTLGPWKAGGNPRVFLGKDGSLGVLVRGTDEKPGPGLVVIGAGKTEGFMTTLQSIVREVHPAPGGAGALVTHDDCRFGFVSPEGESVSMKLFPNGRFTCWVGGTTKAVFRSSLGHESLFHLVDGASGKTLWVTDPRASASLRTRSVHVTGEDGYLLLHGLELLPPRTDPGPSRTTLAIDMKTGAAIARWRPWPFPMHRLSAGSFMTRKGKLYLVADEAFSIVSLEDLEKRAHGWEDYRATRAPSRPGSSRRTDEQRAPFIREIVGAMLPPGWQISDEAYRQVPEGWRSNAGGVLIEVKKDEESCRMWFLPHRWVGIRMPDARWSRGTYWEGIVLGGAYKIIVDSDSMELQNAAYGMLGTTPSLVNGGMGAAQRIFGSDFTAADKKARRLLLKHCRTPEALDAAARSLVVLGVPAVGVIRERALAAPGTYRIRYEAAGARSSEVELIVSE